MNPEVFGDWLRRQGHRVARSASTYWFEIAPRIYQAFPYHHLIEPTEAELDSLLREKWAISLRYSTPVAMPIGRLSYHVVLADKSYHLDSLAKKARYDVRKGLDYACIKPIPLTRLAEEGWLLRLETLERQGRIGAETQVWWSHLCLSADGLPGFEAWGTVHEGQLVAALLAFFMDDCCSILYQQSLTGHLRNGVNNALTYAFTREALSRPKVKQMFYGLHSLDAPTSVDEYKLRMGYTAKPVRQRVLFHPWLKPFSNRTSHSALIRMVRSLPYNRTLAKAEGMLRFYLEGNLPLDHQSSPQALTQRKNMEDTSA
jgi:hypothetical protein